MSVWKQSSLGKTCSPWPDEYFHLSRLIISCLDLEKYFEKYTVIWNQNGTILGKHLLVHSWCFCGYSLLTVKNIINFICIFHLQPRSTHLMFRFLDRNKFKIWQHNESIRINSLFPRCFSKTAWIDCLGAWAYFSCKYLLSAMIRHITAVRNVLLIIPTFFFTSCAMWGARLSMKPEINQIGMDNVVK